MTFKKTMLDVTKQNVTADLLKQKIKLPDQVM